MTRREYIASWHNLFLENVNGALGFIAGAISSGSFSKESHDCLMAAKGFLVGEAICEVERDLSQGTVNENTLERTEIIYVRIAEFFIDITIQNEDTKCVMKEFARRYEHYQKDFTRLQLNSMKS